ncbi:hypothetical protein HUT18_08800 [Streptomyces sp. NA04227]|uniref:hypothetical protein n=1 Tax=Streptomyces sp. NA04227 TaxID=2742136 RepID=UPI00159106E3|nr:hypothetical protein [Streptomyces sp. NA04227]QKW06485.1 hypothetical protein HUT18_08800 [Streptomyces sp. NA04227]
MTGTPDHDGTHGDLDPLMAALLDEPLPPSALEDDRFMAAHERAAADIDLLRAALHSLGDELTAAPGGALAPAPATAPTPAPGDALAPAPGDAPAPEPDRTPTQAPGTPRTPELGSVLGSSAGTPVANPVVGHPAHRSRRRLVFGLAAAGAVLLLGGLGLAVEIGGQGHVADTAQKESAGDHASQAPPAGGQEPGEAASPSAGAPSESPPGEVPPRADGSRNAESYVACARLVVEGDVARVVPVPGGIEERIVLDVTRYYRPSSGRDQVSFVMEVNVSPRLRVGDHVLVGIPRGSASPDVWSTGDQVAKDRAWIEEALPGASRIDPDSCGGLAPAE